MSYVAAEDLVDAIEVLRAARAPRSATSPEAMVFVGGREVAAAASYIDAWVAITRPDCGRAVIGRPAAGAVSVVVAGPATCQWEGLLGLVV